MGMLAQRLGQLMTGAQVCDYVAQNLLLCAICGLLL